LGRRGIFLNLMETMLTSPSDGCAVGHDSNHDREMIGFSVTNGIVTHNAGLKT